MIKDVSELYNMDDAAFNRAVAELAGWTVEHRLFAGYVYHYYGWALLDADDNVRNGEEEGSDTEQEAWARVPDYANDLNAAWALAADMAEIVIIPQHSGNFLASCDESGVTRWKYQAFAHTPARALATAWAAWKLARNEQGIAPSTLIVQPGLADPELARRIIAATDEKDGDA